LARRASTVSPGSATVASGRRRSPGRAATASRARFRSRTSISSATSVATSSASSRATGERATSGSRGSGSRRAWCGVRRIPRGDIAPCAERAFPIKSVDGDCGRSRFACNGRTHFSGIREAVSMATATINPATGETLETFDELSDAGIERALERAWQTFLSYRSTRFAERAKWMHAAADVLEREKEQWGELITTEMGKLRSAAIAEVEKCAWVCRFYADNAERFLSDRVVETEAEA